MVWTKDLFTDGKRVQRVHFSLGVFALRDFQQGKIIEHRSHFRMIRPEGLFIDCQCPQIRSFGIQRPARATINAAQGIEGKRDRGVCEPVALLPNRQGTRIQGACDFELALGVIQRTQVVKVRRDRWVIRAECTLPDVERFAVERFGTLVLALRVIKHRQVIPAVRNDGVIGIQRLEPNIQRSLIQRLDRGVLTLAIEQAAQSTQEHGELKAVGSVCFFGDRNRPSIHRLGALVLSGLLIKRRQVQKRTGDSRMLRAVGLFIGCECTRIQRLGFAVLPEFFPDAREVVERRGNVRVFRSEILLVNGQCAREQRLRFGIETLLNIYGAQRAQTAGQIRVPGAKRALELTHLASQPFDVLCIEPARRHGASEVGWLLLRCRHSGDKCQRQPDPDSTEQPESFQTATCSRRIDSTRAPTASRRASCPFTQTSCTPVGNPCAPLP